MINLHVFMQKHYFDAPPLRTFYYLEEVKNIPVAKSTLTESETKG